MLTYFSREHKDDWWTTWAALPTLKQMQKKQALIPAATTASGDLLGLGRKCCWVVDQGQPWLGGLDHLVLFPLVSKIFPGLGCTFQAQIIAWTLANSQQQLKSHCCLAITSTCVKCMKSSGLLTFCTTVFCSSFFGKAEEYKPLKDNTFQMPWSYNEKKVKPF